MARTATVFVAVCALVALASSSMSALVSAQNTFGPCTFYDAATNAHFDLSRLKLGGGASYTVLDIRDPSQFNYTYTYNVCAAAQPPGNCGTPAQTANVAAYQSRRSDGRCRRLNNNFANVTWGLISDTDPTKGVVMTYKGGENCNTPAPPGTQRQLSLRIHCVENENSASNPYEQPRVNEPSTDLCHFVMDIYSPEGCPRECPVNNGWTCSGTGVCGIDTDLNAPRCFCDANHDGGAADCSAATPSAATRCDGVCIAMIFLVILLSILLVVSCVIFWRVQKLETMNVRFSAMTDALPGAGSNPVDRSGVN